MRLNISHKFNKTDEEDKIDVNTDKTIISPEIGHTVGIKTCPIEAEEIIIGTIDQIIEVEHEKTINMMIGKTVSEDRSDRSRSESRSRSRFK